MKMLTSYVVAVVFFTTPCIQCYPIANIETDPKAPTHEKEEYTLPNGTVVGKYSYTDTEGNPVQVKYFADDSSYGVELKSVKIINTSEPRADEHAKLDFGIDLLPPLPKEGDSILPPLPKEGDSNTGAFSFKFLSDDDKPKVANDFANDLPKTHWTVEKGDFGLPRNIPKAKKCAASKVRIYYNDLNRKGRDINPYNYEMPKVCEQF